MRKNTFNNKAIANLGFFFHYPNFFLQTLQKQRHFATKTPVFASVHSSFRISCCQPSLFLEFWGDLRNFATNIVDSDHEHFI